MGIWTRANGRLELIPPPDNKLLIDFWHFNMTTCPEVYRRIDEYFRNTWFFDKDDKLACISGKFAEAETWLEWMKVHFFEPRGYKIEGDPDIVWEDVEGFDTLDRESSIEYYAWLRRISALSQEAASYVEWHYGSLDDSWKELEEWREQRPNQLPPLNLF
ncbi:MAG: hypothetical protein IKJ77_03665 [Firmicutes bacterium]|nr:hypothetical protein [Bacillota bacterium]